MGPRRGRSEITKEEMVRPRLGREVLSTRKEHSTGVYSISPRLDREMNLAHSALDIEELMKLQSLDKGSRGEEYNEFTDENEEDEEEVSVFSSNQ